MAYGRIFTKSDTMNALQKANRNYEGRRTWDALYNDISNAEQRQINKTAIDYSQAMSDAYVTSQKTMNALNASDLGQGYIDYNKDALNDTLSQAYASYRDKYLSDVSAIQQDADAARQNVEDMLATQAEYTNKYANSAYSYLEDLWAEEQMKEDADNIFLTNPNFTKYLNEVTDEEGNVERTLKSWQELTKPAYEEVTTPWGYKERQYTSLFDEEGNITNAGLDFYEQMFNENAYEGQSLSFGEWLYNNDEDLFNWAQSYNPYDWTLAGTNKGSFNTMIGSTSTNESYTFAKRFGGLSDSQYTNLINKYTESIDTLSNDLNKSSGRYAKNYVDDVSNVVGDLRSLTRELGIDKEIEQDMGITFDELTNNIEGILKEVKSNGDIWATGIVSTLSSGGAGALAGLKYGGPYGALAGAIVGTVVGSIMAVGESEETKMSNKEYSKLVKDMYMNLTNELIKYKQNKLYVKKANEEYLSRF